MKILRSLPCRITVETDEGRHELPFSDPARCGDITLCFPETADGFQVCVTAEGSSLRCITLHWPEEMPEGGRVMGGAWERGYGDLEWRGYCAERVLPWYFFLQSGETMRACGVKTQPGAMCCWTVEPEGYSLYLDVRCGGDGVFLNGRTLTAAEVVRLTDRDPDGFETEAAFFQRLCDRPLLPPEPVYGANNWYYAYGRASEGEVLRDAALLAEMTQGLENRPWYIIDDCWQAAHSDSYNGGPWRSGNKDFPDMPGLAARIRELGVRPGIWVRLLANSDPAIPEEWRSRRDPQYLDPSVPEALDYVCEDIRTLSRWGYGLIKHDFSTFDLLGRWGYQMEHELTDSGWRFADSSKTTAEIIVAFYRRILEAADGAMIMGCNCVSHLGAGLMHLNRTGDDVSGRDWPRTRRMGVNTLAFTLPQHGRFFAIDADCVPLTEQIPEEYGFQWMELVAASGTPFLVSASADYLTPERRERVRRAFRLAAGAQESARPLDWHNTTCPRRWLLGGEVREFHWTEPCGIRLGRF